jgi:hypothetical protein
VRSHFVLPLVLGSALLGCSREIAVEAEESLPAIDASSIGEIRLSLAAGAIAVEPSDDGSIHVLAHRRATGRGETEARARLDRVRVASAPEPDGALRVSVAGPEVPGWSADVIVRAPSSVRVVAETGRGAIRLRDRSASVRASTRDGDVELDGSPAPGAQLELDAAHGSVTCRVPRFLSAHYDLGVENGALRTDSAPFRVPAGVTSFSATTGPDATSVRLRAANGDVRVEGI